MERSQFDNATHIACTILSDTQVKCNETIYDREEGTLTYRDEWFWIYLGIYVCLVIVAGLMSGLTMGLLSLDLMTLKVMKEGGSPEEKKHALKIYPIVKRHHLLLVTLLLANAGAVEAMPIFLDKISGPVTAVIVSVSAVLIFGEVVPQAICTRFGLAIGATLAPLVYFLMALLFVIAWPISKLLDCLLGDDHATFFRRAQLRVLVDLHGSHHKEIGREESTEDGDEEPLSLDEVMIIQGALDMKSKTVHDALVPIDNVFMLSVDEKLDKETMCSILQTSHSRIPIYRGEKSNIIGVLLVKNMIMLDPEDAVPVGTMLESPTQAVRPVLFVQEDMPLFDLLNIFQTGKSHMAFVKKKSQEADSREESTTSKGDGVVVGRLISVDSESLIQINSSISEPIVGIITLEDVIEELIQEEILDESDVIADLYCRLQVAKAKQSKLVKKLHHSRTQPTTLGNIQRLNSSGQASGSYPETTIHAMIDAEADADTEPLLKQPKVVFA